jgi:hypothetical protein
MSSFAKGCRGPSATTAGLCQVGRYIVAVAIFSLFPQHAEAQWSGFGALSYGYQSNPLYNYQHHGDQIATGFLDLVYSRRNFAARYIGGLTLFNQLTERNYLEHGVTLDLTLKRGRLLEPQEDKGDDGSEVDEREIDSGPPDSVGVYGFLGARLTARHDKKAFEEYNNRSAFLTGSYYRGYTAPWHIRIGGEAGYRSYPSLEELSNITGILTTELGFGKASGFAGGGWLFGGLRYYATATYDTSVFVSQPGNSNGKGQGSGKGGSGVGAQGASSKKVLSNADERHVFQIAIGLFLSQNWTGGSARLSGWYRANLSGAARILARDAETATINEDLYNDFFAYEGPEASFSFSQSLPYGFRTAAAFRFAGKTFGGPAFDLEGNQTADSRHDDHFSADLSISRYVALPSSVGIDLSLSGYEVRNASNDQYNDFHGGGLSFGIGIGF